MSHTNQHKIKNNFSVFSENGVFFKLQDEIQANLYTKNKKIDLLTHKEEPFSLSEIDDYLKQVKLDFKQENYHVIHCFYEWGHFYQNQSDLIDEDIPLVIELVYKNKTPICEPIEDVFELSTSVDKEAYFEKFEKGYQKLLSGDCYQFNLTFPFSCKAVNTDENHFSLNSHFLTSYGHSSYIPFLNKTFFSASPESLFEIEERENDLLLSSKPIKGTIKIGDNQNWQDAWELLKKSKKDQAELDMITDLIRNDLSKIDKPHSKVVKRKRELIVSNILHQYSEVEVSLNKNIKLGAVLRAIFPGGSITGAPKKRVMSILNELEDERRGFYCGSTILIMNGKIKASINIRAGFVDWSSTKIQYHAGGGITLLSSKEQEYEEMLLKVSQMIKI